VTSFNDTYEVTSITQQVINFASAVWTVTLAALALFLVVHLACTAVHFFILHARLFPVNQTFWTDVPPTRHHPALSSTRSQTRQQKSKEGGGSIQITPPTPSFSAVRLPSLPRSPPPPPPPVSVSNKATHIYNPSPTLQLRNFGNSTPDLPVVSDVVRLPCVHFARSVHTSTVSNGREGCESNEGGATSRRVGLPSNNLKRIDDGGFAESVV